MGGSDLAAVELHSLLFSSLPALHWCTLHYVTIQSQYAINKSKSLTMQKRKSLLPDMCLVPVGSLSMMFWGLLPQRFKQEWGIKVFQYMSHFSTNVREIFLARSSLSFSWSKAWWYSLDITCSFSMRLSNAWSSEAVASERIFLILGRISLKRFILAAEDAWRRSEQNLKCFN